MFREMSSKQRYDRGDIRRLNAVSILQVLQSKGACSRANVATELGLTRATVSNIVAELLASGLVLETEYTTGTTGRPGLLVTLNPNAGAMIAVDMDLDRITVAVSNFGRESIWRGEVPVVTGAAVKETMERAFSLANQALDICSEQGLDCLGICVGLAGMVIRDEGELAYGPISGWEHVPIKEDWEKRFRVPIFVENEAHLGAFGAHHFGEGSGAQNLIYLSLGVGLAAGIFVDGVLMRGANGFAGQVGHNHFVDNGVKCACGKQGCWVTEIGAEAAIRKFAEVGVSIPSNLDQGVDWVDWVADRAENGDEAVLKVIEEIGKNVGLGIAPLVQTFNPTVVIVGGRYGKLFKFVESTVKAAVVFEALDPVSDRLSVHVSTSGEDSVMGGLATVFDATMKDPMLGSRDRILASGS